MDTIIYNGRKLPEGLCVMIRKLSLRNVGLYDGTRHFFLTPRLDPTDSALMQIRREFDSIDWLEPRDFNEVINLVLNKTTVKPLELAPQSVSVDGADGIPKLQHLIFREASGAETQLIYLGQREFYVLFTNRGTILPGDIIYANTLPFNIGEEEEFSIARESKPFVPEAIHYEGYELHKDYEVSFRFGKTVSIILETPPALYDIIDGDERFGGVLMSAGGSVKAKFMSVLKKVKDNVASLNPDIPLPARELYPGYDELLAFSKQKGISCYILNLLISTIEKRERYNYAFVQDDWHIVMSPDMIKRIESETFEKKRSQYVKLNSILVEELKKIHTRRVGIFFKAPGRVENIDYVMGIIQTLEDLAGQGAGVKGQAKAKLEESIANSSPAPKENLLTGLKLTVVLIFTIFIVLTCVQTSKGVSDYEASTTEAQLLLENGRYEEARTAFIDAYSNYKPRITAVLVSSKHKKAIAAVDSQIDADVQAGIEQIQTMRLANRGQFDKTSEEILFKLLQLRPENEELLKMKDEWLQQ